VSENVLARIMEHNNWANDQVIQACAELSDDQLDAEPRSATLGSIRGTLVHLVAAQRGYLSLLTLPVEERSTAPLEYAELREAARISGQGLLALAEAGAFPTERLQTRDGHMVEPWVVMVQVINHATEHREQIKSMLSALGVTPPDVDGWDYGFATNALVAVGM